MIFISFGVFFLYSENKYLDMKIKLILLTIILGLNSVFGNPPAKKRILVYTKNGKGYVHENITASVEALKKIGEVNNLIVDVSADPSHRRRRKTGDGELGCKGHRRQRRRRPR